MPRYYFDVIVDGARNQGCDGLVAADAADVERMVIQGARELMAEAIRRGDDISHHAFEVRDDDDRIVLRFPFANAIARSG